MKFIFLFAMLFLFFGLLNAVSQQELTEAKALIDSKTQCVNLSSEQLELIGEYFMEQMNPGDAHVQMHKMMGLQEGSEQEKSFHINLAKMMYCSQGGMMGQGGMIQGGTAQGGMMNGGNAQGNTLGTPNTQGMMGQQTNTQGGMMNGQIPIQGMLSSGMMGGYQSSEWSIFSVLYVVLLVGIILFVYFSAVKVLKELMQPKDAPQAKQKAKE